MQGEAARTKTIETLREQVARLDTHAALLKGTAMPGAGGLLAAPSGIVHEVFSDSPANAGAALGFALAQARSLLTPERPGLLLLELAGDAQEIGLPYGLGFPLFGLIPEAVVLIRTETITELLWAMEEAIACRAVAAVVADIAHPHKALDFTASRRLALRTEASGVTAFLVRYARDREASAAKFRWQVSPVQSHPPPFDAHAPGRPRWRVRLEKGSLGARHSTLESQAYLVDWTENGFVLADDNGRGRAGASGVAALSRPHPAALGDRLSEAG